MTRGSFFLNLSFTVLMFVSQVAWSNQAIVQDDWNDANWTANVPAANWTTETRNLSSYNTLQFDASGGPDSSVAVRWKPKSNANRPNRSISINCPVIRTTAWEYIWDERWRFTDKNGDKLLDAKPQTTISVKVDTAAGLINGFWQLTRAKDVGNQINIQGIFGNTTVLTITKPYPSGFNPANGRYYRYHWWHGADRWMKLTAVELDTSGNETSTSYLLAEFDSKLDGKMTSLGAIVGEENVFTALKLTALTTPDGWDANVDNVQLLAVDELPSRPANLDHFVSVNQYGSLEQAIANEVYVALPRGDYVVNNPIVLNRTTPLFLFGAGSGSSTRILWKNPNQPLFVVNRVPRLGIYGLRIDNESKTNDLRAFDFINTDHVQFEMQDAEILGAFVNIGGPVTGILQQVNVSDHDGMSNDTALLLNHPQAEMYLIGFGALFHDHHVHQKQGHLEIYGLSSAYHRVDDVMIETPSPKGTHIIAAGRSEGTNGIAPTSRLLTVTSSSAPVNVVVKATNLGPTGSIQGPMISYNAAGTLWLLGSSGETYTNALVDGVAPNATIVALGNYIQGGPNPPDILPIARSGATIFSNCNMFDYQTVSGDVTPPNRRFVNGCVADIGNVPTVPSLNNGDIPKLNRPIINARRPNGLLVSVTDYGAIPDDGNDDTAAIQSAINVVGPMLYFPAGTYNISQPLTITGVNGGLMAGAGSGVTRIVSTGSSVFETDRMVRITWQGMSLEVAQKYAVSGSVLAIDFVTPGLGPTFNSFYDVAFDGARYGLTMALKGGANCAETMIVDSIFRNSHMGVATGDFNALNEWIHGVTFINNDYNVGIADGRSGGGWYIFSATATGTRSAITQTIAGGHSPLYYNKMISDGPMLFATTTASFVKQVMFDNLTFTPSVSPSPYYATWGVGGGPIFLRSSVTIGNQQYLGNKYAERYAISLHSQIANWDTISLDPYSKKFRLP